MPRGASPKREGEYEQIEKKFEKEGRYKGREKEVALELLTNSGQKQGKLKNGLQRRGNVQKEKVNRGAGIPPKPLPWVQFF